MKIQTILELIEPEIKNYNMQNRRFDRNTSGAEVNYHSLDNEEKKKGYVGAGQYSTVKKDRDPHFVQKTSRDSNVASIDGYWFFIKNVVDNKLWENPYFPRVYQFKKFYKGKQAHYRAKLETLVEMSDLSKPELIAVVTRMVGYDPEDAGIIQPYHKEHKIKDLIGEIFKRVWDGKANEDMDSNMVSAIKSLKSMNEGPNYQYDLHKDNIMFRRGPHGVHPVIVDPFSKSMDF